MGLIPKAMPKGVIRGTTTTMAEYTSIKHPTISSEKFKQSKNNQGDEMCEVTHSAANVGTSAKTK